MADDDIDLTGAAPVPYAAGSGPPAGGWWSPPEPGAPPTPGPPAPPMPGSGGTPGPGLGVIAAVVAGLMLLGAGTGLGWALARGVVTASTAASQGVVRTVPQSGSATNGAGQRLDAQAIAARVAPAVADINTVIQNLGRTGEAAGTGMVLTPSGEVLTNNHVIEGATSIRVTFPARSSSSYTATVLGTDPSADVALLQVQGVSGLPTVTLADSSGLTTGEDVVAIGNALGQGGSPAVTEGTITALDQSITAGDGSGSAEQLNGLIQSDAPISPGDSGGPLVNSAGQVVGMITAGSAQGFRRSASSVGFAIPSSAALVVVNEIRAGHASSSIIIGQPGYLGVSVQDLDAGTAAQLGLNVSRGALVTGVASGSPAAGAGIPRSAVITAIDGAAITSAAALGPAIRSHKPGQQIRVTWVDSNGTHTAAVTLASGPAA